MAHRLNVCRFQSPMHISGSCMWEYVFCSPMGTSMGPIPSLTYLIDENDLEFSYFQFDDRILRGSRSKLIILTGVLAILKMPLVVACVFLCTFEVSEEVKCWICRVFRVLSSGIFTRRFHPCDWVKFDAQAFSSSDQTHGSHRP